MSVRWLFVIFPLLFAGFLVGHMPLSFVTGLAGNNLGNDDSAFGSVWDGHLYGVSIGGARFERIDVRLRALLLLTGRAAFDWALDDAETRAHGLTAASLSGYTLEDVELISTLGGLGVNLPAIDPGESVSLNLSHMRFDPSGCVAASGEIRTGALIGLASQHAFDAPLLSGPLSCVDGVLFADLSGESADMALDLELSLTPTGFYRWRAVARLDDVSLTRVFSAAGFESDGENWRARGEGQL